MESPTRVVEWTLVLPGGGRRNGSAQGQDAGERVAVGRLPRIARLMALAIKFEGMIQAGVAADYADLARLGGVTRARMTQIMNLLNLAPDIQEQILFLPRTLGAATRSRSARYGRSAVSPIGTDNGSFGAGCKATVARRHGCAL